MRGAPFAEGPARQVQECLSNVFKRDLLLGPRTTKTVSWSCGKLAFAFTRLLVWLAHFPHAHDQVITSVAATRTMQDRTSPNKPGALEEVERAAGHPNHLLCGQ